jgi:hypothetical protein
VEEGRLILPKPSHARRAAVRQMKAKMKARISGPGFALETAPISAGRENCPTG